MEQRKESLLARIKRVPVWVWITVAIGAIGLIIAFLSYRAQQQAANSSTGAVTNGTTLANAGVPAGGAFTPSYSTDPNAYAGYGGWGAGYGSNAFDMQSELAAILALLQNQQSNAATVPTGVSPVPPQSGPATFPVGATGASGISVSGILQPAGGGLSGGQTRPGLKLLGGAHPPQPSNGGGAIPPGPSGNLITAAMSAPISVNAARGSGLGPNPPTPGGSPAPGSVSSALRRLPPVPGIRKS